MNTHLPFLGLTNDDALFKYTNHPIIQTDNKLNGFNQSATPNLGLLDFNQFQNNVTGGGEDEDIIGIEDDFADLGPVWEIKRYYKLVNVPPPKPAPKTAPKTTPKTNKKNGKGKKHAKILPEQKDQDASDAGNIEGTSEPDPSFLSIGLKNIGISSSLPPTIEQKKKYRYYWKLRHPDSTEPDVVNLYYPVFASPKFGKATRYILDDTALTSPNLYFIPERFWRQYIFKVHRDEAYEPPYELKFPRAGGKILDAKNISYLDLRIGQMVTVELNGWSMVELYSLLEDGQKRWKNVTSILADSLPGRFRVHSGKYGNAVYFEWPSKDDLPTTCEYVKLRSDDVKTLLTTGGGHDPDRAEIYIPRVLLEKWADQQKDELGWIPDETDPPADVLNAQDPHWDAINQQKFWVRNSDGACVLLTLENATTSVQWTKMLARSIGFREGSGWARTLNPAIKLYLVPVDQSERALTKLSEIVDAAQKKCESKQMPIVLSRKALDRLNKPGVALGDEQADEGGMEIIDAGGEDDGGMAILEDATKMSNNQIKESHFTLVRSTWSFLIQFTNYSLRSPSVHSTDTRRG
jgi:hypothetical protein